MACAVGGQGERAIGSADCVMLAGTPLHYAQCPALPCPALYDVLCTALHSAASRPGAPTALQLQMVFTRTRTSPKPSLPISDAPPAPYSTTGQPGPQTGEASDRSLAPVPSRACTSPGACGPKPSARRLPRAFPDTLPCKIRHIYPVAQWVFLQTDREGGKSESESARPPARSLAHRGRSAAAVDAPSASRPPSRSAPGGCAVVGERAVTHTTLPVRDTHVAYLTGRGVCICHSRPSL